MKKYVLILLTLFAQNIVAQDIIKTKTDQYNISFVGHASLVVEYAGVVIHIDPCGSMANYDSLPKADYILITHHHFDHFDPEALAKIINPQTTVIATGLCSENLQQYPNVQIMNNGDSLSFAEFDVVAVPAYNVEHKRSTGELFHPKGEGNGYVITIDGTKLYIAGDTENIAEMANLTNINVAFLPMNLPYTMTPEMVADATKMFHPKVLYPYHFGDTDTSIIEKLLQDTETEVRIRALK